MRNFHPFKFIAINYKKLIEDLPNNYYIAMNNGENLAKPVEYADYIENLIDIPEEDLYAVTTYNEDEDPLMNYHYLMHFKHPGYFLYENLFAIKRNDFSVGDYFTDGKDYYAFGLIKDNGTLFGVKGFGFINLLTKREEYFNDFFLRLKRNKKNKLIFLGNMYLQGEVVTKNIIIDDILLRNPDRLSSSTSEKRMNQHIGFAYNRIFRFQMLITRDDNSDYVCKHQESESQLHLSDILNAEQNTWNLYLNISKEKEDYYIENNNLSYAPSIRCYSGTIFNYDLNENTLNRINSLKNNVFQTVIDLVEKEKNLFINEKDVFFYLETDGHVYTFSLNTKHRKCFSDSKLKYYFHYDSLVYKKLETSNNNEDYIKEFLKIL